MRKIILHLEPGKGYDLEEAAKHARKKAGYDSNAHVKFLKRSVDARGAKPLIRIEAEVSEKGFEDGDIGYQKDFQQVANADPVVIVGAGPAGLFAALRCLEFGIKPIVLERGKDVQSRRRDLANINKHHIVNPDSNYCFGEGGAGTYSDGKLYTRSKKRGDVKRILEILVAFGAHKDILLDAHPHIGTNKLPNIITSMREAIINNGGEVHFNTRIDDLLLDSGEIIGVCSGKNKIKGIGVILATGHSARDIYQLLALKNIEIEAKPFALGVRVEHSQSLIDKIQYNCKIRDEHLPAAAYSLVQQVNYDNQARGVFSFCMCPGGFIVPSATAPGEVVVNGMSPSRRDSKYANSGIVVATGVNDYGSDNPLAGMEFQAKIEQDAFIAGGRTQAAPAQRMTDFVKGKISTSLLDCSYQPGLTSADLSQILPSFISERLKYAFKAFGKKMKGYYTEDAQILGVESRTSSPVRIPRNKIDLEHVGIKRLYPCGEGAGYAGGIVSAAMDGERCAEMLIKKYKKVCAKQ